MPNEAPRARDGHSHACDDATGERLSAAEVARQDVARVVAHLDDVRRWYVLLGSEIDRLDHEAHVRTVGVETVVGVVDIAADAVCAASTRVLAARVALRAFDDRREGSDATLARRGAA